MDVLGKARLLSTEYVHSRLEYPIRKRPSWGVVREGSLEFVEVEARVAAPVSPTSYEVLRMTLWDEVMRQSPEWSDALTGVPERAECWSVRELFEVLTERANRYYRERASAESEVSHLRTLLSVMGRYDRGLKRQRDVDDDDCGATRAWDGHDPYDPYDRSGGPSSN